MVVLSTQSLTERLLLADTTSNSALVHGIPSGHSDACCYQTFCGAGLLCFLMGHCYKTLSSAQVIGAFSRQYTVPAIISNASHNQ